MLIFEGLPSSAVNSSFFYDEKRDISLKEGELMDPAITTLCVLAVAAFLFVTELIPLAVTAMAACTALGILGVLPKRTTVGFERRA